MVPALIKYYDNLNAAVTLGVATRIMFHFWLTVYVPRQIPGINIGMILLAPTHYYLARDFKVAFAFLVLAISIHYH